MFLVLYFFLSHKFCNSLLLYLTVSTVCLTMPELLDRLNAPLCSHECLLLWEQVIPVSVASELVFERLMFVQEVTLTTEHLSTHKASWSQHSKQVESGGSFMNGNYVKHHTLKKTCF